MARLKLSPRAAAALVGLIIGSMLPVLVAGTAQASPGLIPTTEAQIIELATMLGFGFFGTLLLISLVLAMVVGGRWHSKHQGKGITG